MWRTSGRARNFLAGLLRRIMPSVQINRLRSQINAVINHFENSDQFQQSLTALLELYSDQKAGKQNWFKPQPATQEYHVYSSVLSEIKAQLAVTSKKSPENALANADLLWASDIYEFKLLAISILACIGESQQEQVVERIGQWIHPKLDPRLMKEILNAFEDNSGILLNSGWIRFLSKWLTSDDDEVQRLGLKAISRTIQMNYRNLPQIFNLITPIFPKLRISIQMEMTEVVRALIEHSQAETASFLIMAGTLYPDNEVRAFIRKCLPLFDPYFQSEIRSSLS
jgi:hypothetical protein